MVVRDSAFPISPSNSLDVDQAAPSLATSRACRECSSTTPATRTQQAQISRGRRAAGDRAGKEALAVLAVAPAHRRLRLELTSPQRSGCRWSEQPSGDPGLWPQFAQKHFGGPNLYMDALRQNIRFVEKAGADLQLRRHPPSTCGSD
jgi:hypothetical protein